MSCVIGPVLLWVAVVGAPPASDVPPGKEAAAPTAAEIGKSLLERQASVPKLRIRVSVDQDRRGDWAALRKLGRVATQRGAIEFAFDGTRRYLRQELSQQFAPNYGPKTTYSPRLSPEQVATLKAKSAALEKPGAGTEKSTHVFDGRDIKVLDEPTMPNSVPMGRVLPWATAARPPVGSFTCMYLDLAGWHVPDSTNKLDSSDESLGRRLSAGEFREDPTERRDDHWRHFVSHPQERPEISEHVWLDGRHGHMQVAREYRLESAGGIIGSSSATEPVEIVPGFWLPKKIEVRWGAYSAENTGPAACEVVLVETFQLLEDSRDLDAALFDLPFPPGTVRANGPSVQSNAK